MPFNLMISASFATLKTDGFRGRCANMATDVRIMI